jgi:hypothetical protein
MASLIAEERVHEKKPFYAFSQDISKAYDTVSRHVGKEIAWRRLGVPERFIEMLLDMDRGNRTVVVTAFGCTDELLGEEKGTFEYMRGFCQGASESPAGWVALYDIFLDLQAKYADDDGIEVVTSEGEAMNYFGSVFADDALWVANTRLGIEKRANVSALFLEFMDIKFNEDKSSVMGLEWQTGKHIDLEQERWCPKVFKTEELFEGGRLRMDTERGHYETLEGNFEDGEHIWQSHGTKIAVKGLEEGVKWLGFQWSPMLGRGTVKQTLTKLVQEAIGQLKEVEVSAESTLYLCDAVVWGKMN